jgi:hypothetical protein
MAYVNIIKTYMSRTRSGEVIRVVSGKADSTTARVAGTCSPIPGHNSPHPDRRHDVPGTPLHLQVVPARQTADAFVRWVVVFRNLQEGMYEQTLTGYDNQDQPTASAPPHKFEAPAPHLKEKTTSHKKFFCTVTNPAPSENITDEKDDFMAYGDTEAPEVGTVTLFLTDLNGNDTTAVNNLYTFWDYTDLQFWFAFFDQLGPGIYHLHAEDLSGPQDVRNLEVD